MSDAQEPNEAAEPFEPASTYLEAALVPRGGSTLAKAGRSVLSLVAGLVAGDMEAGPSAIDLCVTRRDTGNEVLRISAGTVVESDQLLMRVRRDLATKSVTEFISEWRSIDDPKHQTDAASDPDAV